MVFIASKMSQYWGCGGAMKSTKELLGARIKELRKKAQISQEELAGKIGMHYKNLSRIEAGRGYPTLQNLENIAAVLKVEMKEFFEFQHQNSRDSVADSINSIIDTASDKEIQLFLRVLRAIAR